MDHNQLIAVITQAVKYVYGELKHLIEHVNTLGREISSVKEELKAKDADKDRQIQELKDRAAEAEQKSELMRVYLCTKDPQAPFCK